MKKLILVGGGGHCRSVIDVVEHTLAWEVAGIIDRTLSSGTHIQGYTVLGNDTVIPDYVKDHYFLVTVGQIKTAQIRKKLFELIQTSGGKLATVVSPRSYVAKSACLGEGTIVMHDALVNANAQIGKNGIINTKALVEHDAIVSDHCHISTAAVINGGAYVGAESFFGSTAVSVQGAIVPEKSIVAAGCFFKGAKG